MAGTRGNGTGLTYQYDDEIFAIELPPSFEGQSDFGQGSADI